MNHSAAEILRMTEPGELFSNDIKTAKQEYTKLAKLWHPDLHGNSDEANAVMAKINTLYEQCVKMIESGTYRKPGFIEIPGKDGKTYEVNYRRSHKFELGTMYIGNNRVLYLVDGTYQDLITNAKKIIGGFKYADDNMRKEFARYLAETVATFETKDNQFGVVVKKTPDLFLLKDILNHYGGKLPVRHMAWILSSLYNLACYIDYAKLSHNAISLSTYFISPQNHSGALLGGWWYSVPQDAKMFGAPADVYSVMPPHVKNNKNGNIQTDLEAIRLIGRELLGDRSGATLTTTADVPKPIADWLRGAPSANSFQEYSKWKQVLDQSFGERKFIEMKIDADILYVKEE